MGEPFELRVRVFASEPSEATLRVYQEGVLLARDGVRKVSLPRGESSQTFQSVVRTAGNVALRAELAPEAPGADGFADNNAASAVAVAPGRPSVLIEIGRAHV